MNKSEMQAELIRLRGENVELKRKIRKLGELNQKAFKRQHEAERKLNAMYECRGNND